MGSVRHWCCVCYDIYEPKRLRLFPKKGCVKLQTSSELVCTYEFEVAELMRILLAETGETTICFQFFYNDEKGVEYLVKRVKTAGQRNTATTVEEKDEYLIDGKVFSKIKIGIGLVLLAIIVFIDVLIIKEIGFNAMLIPGIAMELALCWMLFIDYVFFQVKIGKNGFYCRTNPFNGQWYKYSEITSCREIKRVVRHRQHRRGVAQRRYFFFFEFTDVKGKTRKFRFSKESFEHEVNVLKERIEQAQGGRKV